ncbi:hypothetical protein RCH20_002166 [Psychrobacter sp. PL15]|uniref:hypothetical protein n=1 Tax=Psychrobacter sp. PL15 TaxID=3071719 RepID=UPI002E0CE3FA|nr:hypothetical protein [Psychrobacter sp. PL15]
MDQLRAIRYFSKAVGTGGFTKAAKVFDVPLLDEFGTLYPQIVLFEHKLTIT